MENCVQIGFPPCSTVDAINKVSNLQDAMLPLHFKFYSKKFHVLSTFSLCQIASMLRNRKRWRHLPRTQQPANSSRPLSMACLYPETRYARYLLRNSRFSRTMMRPPCSALRSFPTLTTDRATPGIPSTLLRPSISW